MTIGSRLRAERARIGLSQAAFAEALGAVKKSQTNYELGHSSPTAQYLASAAALGVDVQYVLTGVPSAASPDESELVRLYRASSPVVRAACLRVLGASVVMPPDPPPKVSISGGTQAQVVAGDSKQKRVTVNVGRKKGGEGK